MKNICYFLVFQRRFCKGMLWSGIPQQGFTLVELMLALGIAATLAALAIPSYRNFIDGQEIDQAINDIRLIELKIQRYYTVHFRYPEALSDLTEQYPTTDPWGNTYRYLNLAETLSKSKGKGKTKEKGKKEDDEKEKGKKEKARKDKNLHPINSDYDLYSMGKDGRSVAPLTAKHSRDDIVRANNGGFIGLGEDY